MYPLGANDTWDLAGAVGVLMRKIDPSTDGCKVIKVIGPTYSLMLGSFVLSNDGCSDKFNYGTKLGYCVGIFLDKVLRFTDGNLLRATVG